MNILPSLLYHHFAFRSNAHVVRVRQGSNLEPSVLETDALPIAPRTHSFLRLFMQNVFPAPFAKFFEFYFALYFLFVFARPIVDALARAALEFD